MDPGLSDSKAFVLHHTGLRQALKISKMWPLSQSFSGLDHSISFYSITEEKWYSKPGTFTGHCWWVFTVRCSGKSTSVSSMKPNGESSGTAFP